MCSGGALFVCQERLFVIVSLCVSGAVCRVCEG